jgi:hypothetical protein
MSWWAKPNMIPERLCKLAAGVKQACEGIDKDIDLAVLQVLFIYDS